MHKNAGRRWTNEELELLKKGHVLNKLEKLLDRTKGGIFYKLFELKNEDPGKWDSIYKSCAKQFYAANSVRFRRYQEGYYKRHKKELSKEFREYYRDKVRKKPHKRQGISLEGRINFSYKGHDTPIHDFISDLINLGIIKSPATAYHWIEGYRRPDRNILLQLSKLLRINRANLEKMIYLN